MISFGKFLIPDSLQMKRADALFAKIPDTVEMLDLDLLAAIMAFVAGVEKYHTEETANYATIFDTSVSSYNKIIWEGYLGNTVDADYKALHAWLKTIWPECEMSFSVYGDSKCVASLSRVYWQAENGMQRKSMTMPAERKGMGACIALLECAIASRALHDFTSEREYEIDRLAQIVYDGLEAPKYGKPKWVPNGNSNKQDEARDVAKKLWAEQHINEFRKNDNGLRHFGKVDHA